MDLSILLSILFDGFIHPIIHPIEVDPILGSFKVLALENATRNIVHRRRYKPCSVTAAIIRCKAALHLASKATHSHRLTEHGQKLGTTLPNDFTET